MAAAPPSLRLLIVDDDEELRDLLAQRFRRLGMSVAVAGSAEEALQARTSARYDVGLLDLHLPGLTGIELLARLKERQPELEAIVLTAQGSIETAIEAMRQGAYDYITMALPANRPRSPRPEGP